MSRIHAMRKMRAALRAGRWRVTPLMGTHLMLLGLQVDEGLPEPYYSLSAVPPDEMYPAGRSPRTPPAWLQKVWPLARQPEKPRRPHWSASGPDGNASVRVPAMDEKNTAESSARAAADTSEATAGNSGPHPAVAAILKYFKFEHLPPNLKAVSQPFCELAHKVALELPDVAEKTVALRKLLEAKDCAVRTLVD